MKRGKKFTVFVDGVDLMYEIGEHGDYNKIFSSLEGMKKNSPCYKECGVGQCTLTFNKWVVKQDMGSKFKKGSAYSMKDWENNKDRIRLEGAERHLEYLEKLIEKQRSKVIELKVNMKGKKNVIK